MRDTRSWRLGGKGRAFLFRKVDESPAAVCERWRWRIARRLAYWDIEPALKTCITGDAAQVLLQAQEQRLQAWLRLLDGLPE